MEQLKEPLCLRLQSLRENNKVASADQMWKWSIQMAEGLQYIHSQNVLQADIGLQNLLLDRNDDLKFADFAGSSIDGEDAYVCASARAQYPRLWQHRSSVKDEILQWPPSSTRLRLLKNPTIIKRIMCWKIFMRRGNSLKLAICYSGL